MTFDRVARRWLSAICLLFAVAPVARLVAAEPRLAEAWYSPSELLAQLGEQVGLRWACPETVAGRALAGKATTTDSLLDDACRQWGLAQTRSNGIVVVHRADD